LDPVRDVALASIKGGVGKTTAAVTLAHLAAESGRRVLLWDLDPQGAATHVLRIGQRAPGGARRLVEKRRAIERAVVPTRFEGLDVVPADFSMVYWLLDLAVQYDGVTPDLVRQAAEKLGVQYEQACQESSC
jgi:cellulose biosynthesis protein BcsQ